jgi:hypothetical protein
MFPKGLDEIPLGLLFRPPQQFGQDYGGVVDRAGNGCDPLPVPVGPQLVDEDRRVEEQNPISHGLRTGVFRRAKSSSS